MKTQLFLLLASGLSTAAFAADTQDHLRIDLAVGGAAQHDAGSATAAHVALAWELRPQFSLELWAGRGSDQGDDATPGPDTALQQRAWIERSTGLGLRYDFSPAEATRWRPFVRAGWTRVRAIYEYTFGYRIDDGTGEPGTDEFVYYRDRFELKDNAPYLAVGTRYELNAAWSVSMQVLYLPSAFEAIDVERTEALVGISWRY